MIKIDVVEYAMQFTGAGIGEVPVNQQVLLVENSMIGDALIQNWRDETRLYRDQVLSGKFFGDSMKLAADKAYEVEFRAVSTGFELWV